MVALMGTWGCLWGLDWCLVALMGIWWHWVALMGTWGCLWGLDWWH